MQKRQFNVKLTPREYDAIHRQGEKEGRTATDLVREFGRMLAARQEKEAKRRKEITPFVAS